MKIYLGNDTFGQHSGCKAVMRALWKLVCPEHEVKRHRVGTPFNKDLVKWADMVLVNGEGTLHHGRGKHLMEMLKYGQELGKRTALVNSVFQNKQPFYNGVLKNLDLFSVREELSVENGLKLGGIPRKHFDLSLLTPKGKQTKDYKNKIVMGSVHSEAGVNRILEQFNYPTANLDIPFGDLVENLKTAVLYITGRFHGVCAAILAETPFVALRGNSHKIHGIIKDLNHFSHIKMRACETKGQVDALRNAVLASNQDNFSRFFSYVKKRPHVDPFLQPLEEYLKSLKDICVIGNGEIKNKGKEIDNHESVIRINNYVIDGYEKDAGTKTTVWCHCCNNTEIEKRDFRPHFIPNHPNYHKGSSARVLEFIKKYPNIIIPRRDYEKEIDELLPKDNGKKRASTGLALLYILNSLKIKTDIYGFDSFETGHYWEDKEHPAHSKKEKQIIDNLKYIRRK